MKRKKVLFVPQNGEHLLNMNPVIEILERKGMDCHYLDTNPIFFQDLEYPGNIKVLHPFKKNILSKSFYNISHLKRVRLIFGLKDLAAKIVLGYDLVVVGNDGSLQRQLMYYAKRKNKPCAMILDGLINPPIPFGLGDILKRSKNKLKDLSEYFRKATVLLISKSLSRTMFSPYFPSIIGCGNLDHIYTIGKYSKDEIIGYAPKRTKVFDSGLPRMAVYIQDKEASFSVNEPLSICFITSAYKWHGLSSYHKYQINDILLIKKCLQEMYPDQNIPLYVKLHPREDVGDYSLLKKIDGIFLVKKESFVDSIYKYRVLLSNLSTCIVEGLQLGVEVASLMINFPYWKVKKGFLKSNHVVKLFSEEDLKEYLDEKLKSPKVFYREAQENDFLSSNTMFSKDIIARHLLSLLN
ncbi:hypothetical protein [Flagellimonas baculiformis]|uniref:hypothetical protein n=1 Tax=Flagellimonas baculiformis TaxID=3067310 RepID=UPI00296FAB55|nr:hypothetical protein [Muricauda sp. D6]